MSIAIRRLDKAFGNHQALEGIDLDVKRGELVALLGPSGCGKTTLLRIVAGLESADGGDVLLDGLDVSTTPARERRIGFVFQHYALFRHMTVADNIAFGLRVRPRGERPSAAQIAQRVRELLALVQLDGLEHRLPAQLSGGQRQRVALARALAIEPRVLLLDEPFGALDAQVRIELRRWLRSLHDELHVTSVLVTHDQDEALELADRVVLMNRGRIEQIGTPAEVCARPRTPFVRAFLGSWAAAEERVDGALAEGFGMNFQQLRIVREAVRRNFNLTEVASALYTSQSGVSKHILDLEDELGIEFFVRKGKRLTGLTEPGAELLGIVERMLLDAKNVKRLAEQFAHRDEGSLTIATTHTQARYALPPVVRRFKEAYPKVHLVLHQAGPAEIVALLQSGEADIGIATEALDGGSAFASFPFYDWHHVVVVPEGHALAAASRLTLEALAAHPLITYHSGYTGRPRIDASFAEAGLAPDIVMSALDADVIKTYVEVGLGVGIIASMAFNAARDTGLACIDAAHLFAPNTTRIAVRRGRYLRGYAYRFLEECSAALTPAVVKGALDAD